MTCAKVFILHVVATVSSRSSESSWASSSPALSPLRRVAASRSMSSVIAEARRISLSNADCKTHKHTDTPTEKEREKKKKKERERERGTPHQHVRSADCPPPSPRCCRCSIWFQTLLARWRSDRVLSPLSNGYEPPEPVSACAACLRGSPPLSTTSHMDGASPLDQHLSLIHI